MTDTVLSHLAVRFAVHPENVATEALAFILKRSPDARLALTTVARRFGFVSSEELHFDTQITDEAGARPDIVGKVPSGAARLVVEAKFWAGLTDAQPVGYLKSMPAEASLLLFVAPGQRFETLWTELYRRCVSAGLTTVPPTTPERECRYATVGEHVIGLTSWRILLDAIRAAVETAGDAGAAADVRQLSGLCGKMDSEAFLPLTSDELTSSVGRRIIQFGDLASDLTEQLVAKGLASVKGLRASGANGWFGRYLLLKGYGCFLHFSSWRWAHWGDSPLWLSIQGPDWKASAPVREALAKANLAHRNEEGGCQVPILLSLGVERDAIVQGALAQLELVAAVLPAIDVTQAAAAVPPSDDAGAGSSTE